MTWQPTELQTVAKLDPDVDCAHEAEARVRAARALLEHWLTLRDPMLLTAAEDMVAIARCESSE